MDIRKRYVFWPTKKKFKKHVDHDIRVYTTQQTKLEEKIKLATDGPGKKALELELAEKQAKIAALKDLKSKDNVDNLKNGSACYKHLKKNYGAAEDALNAARQQFVTAAKRKKALGTVRQDKHQRRMDDAGKDHALVRVILKGVTQGNLGKNIERLNSAIKERDQIRKRIDKKEGENSEKKLQGISLEKHERRLADYEKDHEISNQLLEHAATNDKTGRLKRQFESLKIGIKERNKVRKEYESILQKKPTSLPGRINDCEHDYKQANAILARAGEKGTTRDIRKSFSNLKKAVDFREKFRKNHEDSTVKLQGKYKEGEDSERKREKHQRISHDAGVDCAIINKMIDDAVQDPDQSENLSEALESFKKLSESRDKIRDRLSSYEKKNPADKTSERYKTLQKDYEEATALFDAAAESPEGREALPDAIENISSKVNYRESLLKKIESKAAKIAKLKAALATPEGKINHNQIKLDDAEAEGKVLQELLETSRGSEVSLEDSQQALSDYKKQSEAHKKLQESLNLTTKNDRALEDAESDLKASRDLIGKPNAKELRKQFDETRHLRDAIRGVLERNEKKQVEAGLAVAKIADEITNNQEARDQYKGEMERKIAEKQGALDGAGDLDVSEKAKLKTEIKELQAEGDKKIAEFGEKEKNLKEKLEKQKDKKDYYDKKVEALEGKYQASKDAAKNYDTKDLMAGLNELTKKGGTKQIRKEAKVAASPLVPKESTGNKVFRKIFGASSVSPSVNIKVNNEGISAVVHPSNIVRDRILGGLGARGGRAAADMQHRVKEGYHKGALNVLPPPGVDQAVIADFFQQLAKSPSDKVRAKSAIVTIATDMREAKIMAQAAVDAGIKVQFAGNKKEAIRLEAEIKDYQREKNERKAEERRAAMAAAMGAPDAEADRARRAGLGMKPDGS